MPPSAAPRSWPLIGVLPAMRRAPHEALAALQAAHGDRVRVRVGPLRLTLLGDPESCRQLLQGGEDDLAKRVFYDKLRPAMGDGLVTSAGDTWRRQRALIQPLLTPRAVRRAMPAIAGAAGRLLDAWDAAAGSGTPVDAAESAGRLAREVALEALFGVTGGGQHARIAAALATVEDWTGRRFYALVDPHRFPSPGRRRFHRALATLQAEIDRLIDARAAEGADGDDLLSRLLRASGGAAGDASGDADPADRRQLRDEVMTLYLAGQETTAMALAWTLWRLARDADLQATLYREAVDALGPDPARTPDADTLRALPWLRATVDEGLRLYPPVWSFNRTTRRAMSLNGEPVAAGETCVVAPWTLHRRPDLWDDPAAFRPARFLEGPRPRAFMPFGAGPRNCVGADLALLELQTALAAIVRRFQLTDAGAAAPQPLARVTLIPQPAPRLRLQRRG